MTELSDDEWRALCRWQEELRQDDALVYVCEGPLRVSGTCCSHYDWRSEECFGNPLSVRGYYHDRAAPGCTVTVVQYARCVEAREALECFGAYPAPAECAGVFDCPQLDASSTLDAGPAADR